MKLIYQILCACVLFLMIQLPYDSDCLSQGDAIAIWANRIGKELWNLGELITKKEEIMQKYKNVTIERKDPKQIITEIVGNISYMMRKKMDAVECILHVAEEEAKNYTLDLENRDYKYYRSNPPSTYMEDEDFEDPDEDMYLPMVLENDTHFYKLFVNINYSAVHVPTNVYHRHLEPETTIKWSEVLDKIFVKNYKADPALSWQYFGSATGIMRHYPAMNFGVLDQGLFDCRIRTWFIEAATCTKDVVILLDNTGSMMGMHKHIASLVVNTILDTLSNNDYVNIISYSESVEYIVPCFENVLVQATEENILMFKKAVQQLDPTDKATMDIVAMEKAFELLHETRKQRNCHENSRYCNQAIMLVTDGVSNNLNPTLDKYNRADNGSSIPIRIFTFIVGKEATDLAQALSIACTNRGYYIHIDSLEQVTAAVYKYILVFARPLVLQGIDRPLSWTHAYFDETFKLGNKTEKFEEYRLLTSVAGPAFDLKANNNNTTRVANLLGVAGTDVPISELSKLMCPYKTGVNSHSFIVSNNGYVLKHPGLRPMFEGTLKDNYNSVDLVEVEQLDDDLEAREINDTLIELRRALVFGEEGVMHDINIKYHYDDMRRVSREINDYYYAPINDTPFSIGFAIPDLYGNFSIEVGDEIERHRFSETNISSFFDGSNWKIHPKWVYCKYHYLEDHEYRSPEEELVHFINRTYNEDFKWEKQYEVHEEKQGKCGTKTLDNNAYYCDRHLVQRLVFDAVNTKNQFDEPWRYRSGEDEILGSLYNASLRFIATMSGLTRWEYLRGEGKFGDSHSRAIDETWYKSAVIQHRYSNDSFVYSVPFEYNSDEELVVTGSLAIFPSRDDIAAEAPGAVIGFQFSHESLQKRFFEITSRCRDCLPCGEELACYIVDSSGYIVLSEDSTYTGIFFGEIDGAIMEAMIQQNIFEKLVIRDYQAICVFDKLVRGSSNVLTTPFYYIQLVVKWIFTQITWIIIKTNLYELWDPRGIFTYAAEEGETQNVTHLPKKCRKCEIEEEIWHERNRKPEFTTIFTGCEKERDLYILQQQLFSNKRLYKEEVPAMPCVRPFYVHMIPHSNLLFIAIKVAYPSFCEYKHTTAIREIVYENETAFPCQKLSLNTLQRRSLAGCYNENPLEKEITDCGKSARIESNRYLIIIFMLLTTLQTNKLL